MKLAFLASTIAAISGQLATGDVSVEKEVSSMNIINGEMNVQNYSKEDLLDIGSVRAEDWPIQRVLSEQGLTTRLLEFFSERSIFRSLLHYLPRSVYSSPERDEASPPPNRFMEQVSETAPAASLANPMDASIMEKRRYYRPQDQRSVEEISLRGADM